MKQLSDKEACQLLGIILLIFTVFIGVLAIDDGWKVTLAAMLIPGFTCLLMFIIGTNK